MKMVIPGLRAGGALTNCAGPGLPEDRVQLVKIAQQAMADAGLDVGRVDGAFGPRTRRALLALQEQLGLERSGEIDEALFAALGFSQATVEPTCVTVELPQMPRPPEVKCEKGQKKNSKGQCYTPRKTPVATATPSRDGPSCDGRTTVSRGSECVCRYQGMRQISNTRCACRSGIPPVRGVGCVNISIEGTIGGGRDAPAGEERNCVTVLGRTQCF